MTSPSDHLANDQPSTYQPEVRDQYEAYPYPARDPKDERKRLVTGSPSNLAEVNHYLFKGRRDFAQPFRALVAGGGTGDATIMLAQQLADHGDRGEVVYLDLSTASRKIAESRAKERGLDNITFLNGSLLDLPEMGLAPFDYIDCCGVLHHLEESEAGLKALTSALKPEGGLGLMVYGAYGREGVYPLQELLRTMTRDCANAAEKVALTRRLLEKLPESNGFRRNPFVIDHKASDAELVDLLLHTCDRAYTVPQLAELVASAELQIAGLIEPLRYRPETYLKDPKLLAPLKELPELARAAAAEKLAGNMKMHVFYATPVADSQARLDEPERAIPVLRQHRPEDLAAGFKKSSAIKLNLDGVPLNLPLPRLAAAIAARCDGKRDLGAIFAELQTLDSRLEWEAFLAQFEEFFAVMNGLNHLFLRFET